MSGREPVRPGDEIYMDWNGSGMVGIVTATSWSTATADEHAAFDALREANLDRYAGQGPAQITGHKVVRLRSVITADRYECDDHEYHSNGTGNRWIDVMLPTGEEWDT